MKWLEAFPVSCPPAARLLEPLAVLLSLIMLLTVSWLAYEINRDAMTTVRVTETRMAARMVASSLDRAIGYGVPLNELPGVEAYLDARLRHQPDLSFIVVTDAAGVGLHQAGLDPVRVREVLQHLTSALPDPGASNSDEFLEAGGFSMIRLPLIENAGAVVVGVERAGISRGLARDVLSTWPFWFGCLFLVLAWASIAVRAAVLEPLLRLSVAMAQAGRGNFGDLLVRRARDAVGRCLFAFNATVSGVWARREALLSHAEDVRHAVFDHRVALAVDRARDEIVRDLGEGLASPPQRLFDDRASDADVLATGLAAAGSMGMISVLPSGWAAWLSVPILVLAGFALGWRIRHWCLIASLAGSALLAAFWSLSLLVTAPPALSVLAQLLSVAVIGLAWGIAFAQRRRAGVPMVSSGGLSGMLFGTLAGCLLAWSPVMDAVGVAILLSLLAVASILLSMIHGTGVPSSRSRRA